MHATRSCRRLAWTLLVMVPAALQSQPIYRCGNAYSQTPCADGSVISADDRRTPAQKAQTDTATTQTMRLADRMERERLDGERRTDSASSKSGKPGKLAKPGKAGKAVDGKAKQPAPSARTAARPASPKAGARNPVQEPGYFTASTRQDEKAKPATAPKRK